MLIFAGCATFTKPFKTANTPQQKAYALYGTFVEIEEQVADIVTTQEIDEEVLEAIKHADLAAKITFDMMLESAKTLTAHQQEFLIDDGVLDEEELAEIQKRRQELVLLIDKGKVAMLRLAELVEVL